MRLFSKDAPKYGARSIPHNSQLETSIGANSSIKGSLHIDGDARIDGTFEGDIAVVGKLIIGATGRVIANIQATSIHVAGAVKGDIVATDRLEISETGKVWGTITALALHIEPGGVFQGQSAMQSEEEPLVLEAPEVLQ
ncbi:MAG: polymer-forming cytoskeletal protein [Herpetosiphonaceae bacterium]|nr:polymer-forming cytoskeletal protein [Herpetosiphonaceae bacterium]